MRADWTYRPEVLTGNLDLYGAIKSHVSKRHDEDVDARGTRRVLMLASFTGALERPTADVAQHERA